MSEVAQSRDAKTVLRLSLAAMIDPDVTVWQLLQHARDASDLLDVRQVDAATIEEAASAFEAVAGRLRGILAQPPR